MKRFDADPRRSLRLTAGYFADRRCSQNPLEIIVVKLNQAIHVLESFVEQLVAPLGFKRKDPLWFIRQTNEATASLSFPCRIDSHALGCFTVGIGLEFPVLVEKEHRGDSPKATWQPRYSALRMR